MQLTEPIIKYKRIKGKYSDDLINSSTVIYEILQEFYKKNVDDINRENFVVVFLNKSNKIISIKNLFQGGISSTVVDIRIIIKYALLQSATSLIVSHNHPSGSLTPSREDLNLTKKIHKALLSMDMDLLDHIIVGDIYSNNFKSLTDEGLL